MIRMSAIAVALLILTGHPAQGGIMHANTPALLKQPGAWSTPIMEVPTMVRVKEVARGVQSGQLYGSWTVIGKPFSRGTNGSTILWSVVAQCKCGRVAVVLCSNLRCGISTRCATCHMTIARPALKHGGAARERLYTIWKQMRQRCLNRRAKAYKDYGGRGITICTEWTTYPGFRNWALSNGYESQLTIDRKNHNGNYEPSNCQWITRSANTAKGNRDRSRAKKSSIA